MLYSNLLLDLTSGERTFFIFCPSGVDSSLLFVSIWGSSVYGKSIELKNKDECTPSENCIVKQQIEYHRNAIMIDTVWSPGIGE